jgi:hypothetical protein
VEITWPEAVSVGGEHFDIDTPKEAKMANCDHTYKPAGDNYLKCQKCNKEVNIMGG